jgi:hypothetical protein
MSTVEVKIPDLLSKQVNEVATKEKVSVDQIVSIALAAQVSASQAHEGISSRAKRVEVNRDYPLTASNCVRPRRVRARGLQTRCWPGPLTRRLPMRIRYLPSRDNPEVN